MYLLISYLLQLVYQKRHKYLHVVLKISQYYLMSTISFVNISYPHSRMKNHQNTWLATKNFFFFLRINANVECPFAYVRGKRCSRSTSWQEIIMMWEKAPGFQIYVLLPLLLQGRFYKFALCASLFKLHQRGKILQFFFCSPST